MKKFIYLLVLVCCSLNLFASHYMGGEITWECLPNGNYRFIMKVYRECNGCEGCFQNQESLLSNVPNLSNITINLYPGVITGRKDISPDCNSNPLYPHINCFPAPTYANTGAVEEFTYTTDLSYPEGVNLPAGPIPASGWSFVYTNCCRNPASNYSNTSANDWFLKAVMYPYPGLSPNLCWDNSPAFAEKPLTVNCIGFPFTYNPIGYDKERDSLHYEWTQPLISQTTILTGIVPGYAYNSPLPGTLQNPNNVPAVVNPLTGEVSFTSFTTGAFITAYKVTAYKCGVKIAEIFREMQMVLLACPDVPTLPSNLPPEMQPPFQNAVTGLYSDYVDTVMVGSVVDFAISTVDNDLLNDGLSLQNITLSAWSSQFGTAFSSDVSGCLLPPCATLSPPPPITENAMLNTNFHWQTTMAHLQAPLPCAGVSLYRSYEFIFQLSDDYCPVPARNYKRVTIVLTEPNVIPSGADTIAGPAAICLPEDSLIYTVPAIANAMEYHWTLPPGFTGSSLTNSIVVHAGLGAASGNVTVVGANSLGNGTAASLFVSVVPQAYAGPDQTILPGTYAILTASATSGTPPFTYMWSNGLAQDSIVVSPATTSAYTLTVSEAGGCQSIDTVKVLVSGSGIVGHADLETLISCAGVIEMPLHFANFQNVDSLVLRLSYPSEKLMYSGFHTVDPLLSGNNLSVVSQNGKLFIRWHGATSLNFSNIQALILKFNYEGGGAQLEWDLLNAGACTVFNTQNQAILMGYTNGTILAGSCASLSGKLKYANTMMTPLSNVNIILKSNGNWIAETMTDNAADFFFVDLPMGQFSLEPQCTKPWGGVNAADALSILKHNVGLSSLSGIRAVAANVDLSPSINSLDALWVAQRYAEIIPAFPTGNWVYWNTTLNITTPSAYTLYPTALCAGDVNASYVPALGLMPSYFNSLNPGGNQKHNILQVKNTLIYNK